MVPTIDTLVYHALSWTLAIMYLVCVVFIIGLLVYELYWREHDRRNS